MKDIYGFLTFKKVEIIEKADAPTLNFDFKWQLNPSNLFLAQSLRNNWKPLFEVNFSKNSTKTIRLFALDFYEVIVDSAINYCLMEISSS